ncbi:hypothetical protein OROMI_024158 [Orobanche minor]
MGSDTEHSDSTPQPPVSNNANMGPPKHKSRSKLWDHFTPMPEMENLKSAKCNYCCNFIKYGGGTSAMIAHLKRCKEHPNMMMHESDSSSLRNREVSRIDLVNMFVALELPFKTLITCLWVISVGQKIVKMCHSEDANLKSMALKMRNKYNKYWGKPDSLNMLLIAMV